MISLVTLGLGLLAVIAIIFGCAWIVRRMSGLSGMNNQAIKVVSVMALGARERIALIDVGGTQILVGITASAIRTLHVFDEPVVTPGDSGKSDFAQRLQGLIGGKWQSQRPPPDVDLMNPKTGADSSSKPGRSDGKSS
ncbi:flagellar biosynthetic protein FliO [Marinobacter sp.]|uniref:flagellar biosynthetic protein FliO n=1 Tax=Marinobacter sp. TaxID=50741 RepID=UPI00384B753F